MLVQFTCFQVGVSSSAVFLFVRGLACPRHIMYNMVVVASEGGRRDSTGTLVRSRALPASGAPLPTLGRVSPGISFVFLHTPSFFFLLMYREWAPAHGALRSPLA